MGIRKRSWCFGMAALMVLTLVVPTGMAWSQQTYEFNLDGDIPHPTGFEKGLTKLGRGLSNILFGWAEIPVTFNEKLNEGKSLQYLVGVVPVLGTARAVMRTATGVFEAVTFPYSDRAVNYGPVLEPEYLF